MQLAEDAYHQLDIQDIPVAISTPVNALAGAQMCVADLSMARRMNIKKFTPFLNISVADNADLKIMGAAFVMLTSQAGYTTKQMVYFADGIKD